MAGQAKNRTEHISIFYLKEFLVPITKTLKRYTMDNELEKLEEHCKIILALVKVKINN